MAGIFPSRRICLISLFLAELRFSAINFILNSNTIKNPLGWKDSNLRVAVPKTAALPLGDTPAQKEAMILQQRKFCNVLSKRVNGQLSAIPVLQGRVKRAICRFAANNLPPLTGAENS